MSTQKPRLVTVHGLHEIPGERDACDPIADLFERAFDIEWVDVDYGHFTAWDTTDSTRRSRATNKLMYHLQKGDHVMAHSFGCWVVHDALWRMWSIDLHLGNLFFFAPALAADVRFPETGFQRASIIYNRYDTAIGVGARLMEYLGSSMGLMGIHGSLNANPRVFNVPVHANDDESLWNHDTFNRGKFKQFWVAYMARLMKAEKRQ